MTKEAYFDMAQQLGFEPVEADIPVELSDFPVEVQVAFNIWFGLPDNIDTFGGNYFGKHLTGLADIFQIYEVHPMYHKFTYTILQYINNVKIEQQSKKKSNKPSKASP